MLFSNPAVPARTLKEFIAYARGNPGKVNYGVPGLGTVNHLMMERLKQTTDTQITCIPYRGSPPAVLALLKNEIQVFPIGLAAVGTSFGEGKLTALAVATQERVPMLPNVPTIAESGYPGFVASNWFGWPRRPARPIPSSMGFRERSPARSRLIWSGSGLPSLACWCRRLRARSSRQASTPRPHSGVRRCAAGTFRSSSGSAGRTCPKPPHRLYRPSSGPPSISSKPSERAESAANRAFVTGG